MFSRHIHEEGAPRRANWLVRLARRLRPRRRR
jgi:hypothetical protein